MGAVASTHPAAASSHPRPSRAAPAPAISAAYSDARHLNLNAPIRIVKAISASTQTLLSILVFLVVEIAVAITLNCIINVLYTAFLKYALNGRFFTFL